MKTHPLHIVLVAALVACGHGAVFAGEPPGLPRGDAWAGIGWHHVSSGEEDTDRSWDNRRLIGSAGGGWYWSPHFKTEVDAHTTSRSSFYHFEQILTGDQRGTRYSRITYETQTIAAVQTYEFLSNSWFTPYAGAGLAVARQTREEYIEPIVIYDTSGRATRVQDARELEPERRTLLRPLAAVGFKAYLSRRAFFRTDARLVFRSRLEQVLIRFGFGADF